LNRSSCEWLSSHGSEQNHSRANVSTELPRFCSLIGNGSALGGPWLTASAVEITFVVVVSTLRNVKCDHRLFRTNSI
jgi:hypothetical protein